MTEWFYPRCYVDSVYDGDTIRLDIDLGQDMWVKRRPVRLHGIACRELSEPGGREARDYLSSILPKGALVAVKSVGWDKYGGRIVGAVFTTVPDSPNQLADSVQFLMMDAGYAVPWDGKGKQPKPIWPIPTE